MKKEAGVTPLNKDIEKLAAKIYIKRLEQSIKSIDNLKQLYERVEREDISKFKKLWNIITFRKNRNYIIKQKIVKITGSEKPSIQLKRDDKE